jgi:hypothetical protein
MDGKMKKSIVELAKERDDYCKSYYATSRELSRDDIAFVMGDSDNMYQWPDEVRKTIDGKVTLTVNITAQHCNAITNNIRMNRPQSKVIPQDGNADKKTAEIMEGWVRSVQSYSNSDDAHDCAMEFSVWGGEGYWRVTLDYEDENSFNEVPFIKPIQDPSMVYIDPFAQALDKSDARYGFIKCIIPNDEFDNDPEFSGVQRESWPIDGNWVMKDSVVIAEYFYCDEINDTLEMYQDGTSGLKSENKEITLPDGTVQPSKPLALSKDGKPIKRKTTRKQWYWCKLVGGHSEPIQKRMWPGKYLPIVGTYGKSYNIDGQHVVKGVVRDLKDPARIVNYSYSAAIETVALQTKVPFIASHEAINGFEREWAQANTSNDPYLPYNQYDGEGKPIEKPERQQAAVMPSAQLQLLSISIENLKEASGQHAAVFGQSGNESSGVAIQRRKQQGEVATFHYPDNLSRALRYECVILLDLMPKVCTEEQIVRILGLDGKEEQAKLQPNLPQAFAETSRQDLKGIFNPAVGKYDVAITTGPSYATQRQETAEMLSNLAQKDPRFMAIAGDIFFRALDVPLAEDLARRYEKTIDPKLMDDTEDMPIPPQAQAQMAEMNAALEQAAQKVQLMDSEFQKLMDEKANLEAQARDAKAKATMSDIEAKEAKSLLTIGKASQGMKEESDDLNPDIEEIMYRIAEQETKQDAMLDGIYRLMEVVAAKVGVTEETYPTESIEEMQ